MPSEYAEGGYPVTATVDGWMTMIENTGAQTITDPSSLRK